MEILLKSEPFLLYGIIKGCLYALLAVGFCLVYQTTKIFHVAYGFIYTIAPYAALLSLRHISPNIYLAIAFALLLTGATGLGIEKLVYFPLKKRESHPGIYIVSSIGVYIIGVNIVAIVFGNRFQTLTSGVEKKFQIHQTTVTGIQIAQFFVPLIILILFFWLLKKLMLGKLITAIAGDPELFEIYGWSQTAVRKAIFITSSIFAGIASLLIAMDVGTTPYGGMDALLIATVAMVIGGVKNFYGVAIAAVSLGIVQNLVIWQSSARWEQTITFCILILYLLLFRKRILGRIRIEEE